MMLDCISVENMRRSDRHTIASGISGLELIARAALGIYSSVPWHGRIAIVAGSGNNGADGLALACVLHQQGIGCVVYTVSEGLHEDAAYYAAKAEGMGIPIAPYRSGVLGGYDMIVDCMLGTGFGGSLKPRYREAIEEINASDAYIVSADINSGLNGDSGEGQTAVCSDHTVTIGFIKRGLVVGAAGEYIKRLSCIDIGIRLLENEDYLCDAQDWTQLCGDDSAAAVRINGSTYYKCPPWVDMSVERFADASGLL